MLQPLRNLFARRTKILMEEHANASSAAGPGGMPPIQAPTCLQYDNFHKEYQQISQQDNFDGFRIEAGKPVTKNLQMSHTLILGSQQRGSTGPYQYQFGPIFQSESGRTFILGKYNLDGFLNCRIVKKIFGPYCDLGAKIGSDLLEPTRNVLELSKDLNFGAWSASTKFVYQGIFIGTFSFAREIIKDQLYLGAELTCLKLDEYASMGTVSGRYVHAGNHIFTGQVGRTPDLRSGDSEKMSHGVRIQYANKISDRVSLGAEFDYNHPDHDSAFRFGYEYTFRTSRVQGLVDTAGRVSCFINDFKGYALSGLIDYSMNDYKFGMLMHYYPVSEGGEGGEQMMM